MLSDLPKNIFRSLTLHVRDNYTLTPVYYEGEPQRNSDLIRPYIELRMDGPFMTPLESGRLYCQFEANILIVVGVGQNHYLTDEIGGVVLQMLYNNINIVDTDDVFLGCAQPYTRGRKMIEFNKFGIIDPQSEIIQSTVEIRFSVTLEI